MKRRTRRKYWIDVRTQGPFLLKIGSVWAAGVLLLCLLLYFLSDEELGRSFYSVHLRIRNTWQILLPAVALSGGVSFLVIIGATLSVALRESHRLGGPIFKFTRLFRQLQEGVFDPDFRFREGDLLSEMGEGYRTALQRNRDRIASLQDLSRTAEANLLLLRDALESRALASEEKRFLEEAAASVSRLRKAAGAFHVGTP